MERIFARLGLAVAGALASGCASAPAPTGGFLSSYDRLAPQDSLRAEVSSWRDEAQLAGRSRVTIAPTRLTPSAAAALTPDLGEAVRREVDRQLCLELSERFEVIPAPEGSDVIMVRAAVTDIAATSVAASLLSAAASRTIPGPGAVRVPLGLGALAAEAEALDAATGAQMAAMTWSRRAQIVMDKGSLSPAGDAHQMAEPFGDAVGALIYVGDRDAPRRERPEGLCGPGIGADDVGRFLAERALGLHMVDSGGE